MHTSAVKTCGNKPPITAESSSEACAAIGARQLHSADLILGEVYE
jgi:hypothetical protein